MDPQVVLFELKSPPYTAFLLDSSHTRFRISRYSSQGILGGMYTLEAITFDLPVLISMLMQYVQEAISAAFKSVLIT